MQPRQGWVRARAARLKRACHTYVAIRSVIINRHNSYIRSCRLGAASFSSHVITSPQSWMITSRPRAGRSLSSTGSAAIASTVVIPESTFPKMT